MMSLPGRGGAVGVGTVLEAAEREAFKIDNRRKLGAAASVERHLAVYVYLKQINRDQLQRYFVKRLQKLGLTVTVAPAA